MTDSPAPKPQPHPGVAAAAIALMALVVAVALALLGPVGWFDGMLEDTVRSIGLSGDPRTLAAWVPWVWTAGMTVALCQVLLHLVGQWRRVVVFVTALLLTVAWLPVLALASFRVPLGAALAALLWGGFGSMIYAARHREP